LGEGLGVGVDTDLGDGAHRRWGHCAAHFTNRRWPCGVEV
jgi:hypothetical protein